MSFFTLLTTPFFFIYDVLTHIANTALIFIIKEYLVLKENIPETVFFLNLSRDILLMTIKAYQVILLFEYMISYFPRINPYTAPYYLIRVLTAPVLKLVRYLIPGLFGFDVSFIALSLFLEFLVKTLPNIKF